MKHWNILHGHTLEALKTLPSESVHCCVTSPPYWGLRDYGLEPQIFGGAEGCAHQWGSARQIPKLTHWNNGGKFEPEKRKTVQESRTIGEFCQNCDAWRGSLGLEPTPQLFIEHLVTIFLELRRVLRHDGTLFLNLGDTYANDTKWGGNSAGKNYTSSLGRIPRAKVSSGLKPKDLVMIPHRAAIALQESGWWVRQDLIWSKTNPMPESTCDRFTKSHEYVFLLTKSKKYFFDHVAAQEPAKFDGRKKTEYPGSQKYTNAMVPKRVANSLHKNGGARWQIGAEGGHVRNRRSVLTCSTANLPQAHFATFPEKLIEPLILAGTSAHGCCSECGAPYKRKINRAIPSRSSSRPQIRRAFKLADAGGLTDEHFNAIRAVGINDAGKAKIIYNGCGNNEQTRKLADEAKEVLGGYFREFLLGEKKSDGWEKSCRCATDEIEPCIVLDPFNGAGTTGMVSLKNKRKYVGIELNPEYIEISRDRLKGL